jgi:hypothetical protein
VGRDHSNRVPMLCTQFVSKTKTKDENEDSEDEIDMITL